MRLYNRLSPHTRKLLPLATVVVAIVAIPVAAEAIPGSGSFVSGQSASGETITHLYNVIAKICLGILIVVEGILFYAIFKFRRRSEDEDPEPVHGNFQLEVGWTLAALVIQIFIGVKSIDVMFDVETEPQQGTELVVEAIGKQWDWDFRYPEQQFKGEKIGGFTAKDLVVPANTQVELDVTSNDVLHSLAIPALGVKIDAVPGRYNYWWFSAEGPVPSPDVELDAKRQPATKKGGRYVTTRSDWTSLWPGSSGTDPNPTEVDYLGGDDVPEKSPYRKYEAVEYKGMCTELCGRGHWNMYFRTVAMTRSSFFQWVEDVKSASQSGDVDGAKLYSENCAQCHQDNGQGVEGNFPPLAGSRWTNDEDMKKDHIEVVLLGSNAESLKGPTEVKGTTYEGAAMSAHKSLNDAEVRAVVNHERQNSAWGNSGGKVTEEMVAEVRKDLGLEPRPVVESGGVEVPKLKKEGERLYQSCTGCHGADGKGPEDVPSLVDNAKVLGSVDRLVDVLVNGQDTERWPGRQTPVGRSMTDRELAGLVTYIRSAWGNEGSAVQPPEINRIRKKLEK